MTFVMWSGASDRGRGVGVNLGVLWWCGFVPGAGWHWGSRFCLLSFVVFLTSCVGVFCCRVGCWWCVVTFFMCDGERINKIDSDPSHVSRRLDFFEIQCHSITDQHQIPCYMTPLFLVWLNEEVSLTFVFVCCCVGSCRDTLDVW